MPSSSCLPASISPLSRVFISRHTHLIAIKKRARSEEICAELGRTPELWLLGKLLSMTVIVISCAAGLWLLDLPLAITLGRLSGLLDFIPYLGPILAGIPAMLIAFSDSPMSAFYVLLLFIALQSAEGYLIPPLVGHKAISRPPTVTLGIQVVWTVIRHTGGPCLSRCSGPIRADNYAPCAGYPGDDLKPPIKQ